MKQLTISLPDDLAEALDDYRRRQVLSEEDLAAVVGTLLRQHLMAYGYLWESLPFRPLIITPFEEGSGLSDVSINHDHYLAEDLYERTLPRPR